MNIMDVIIAAAAVGLTGLIVGVLLGMAGKAFSVEVDEKEEKVRALLPGNNCGGCGFAGCDALAKAIASGKSLPSECPVNNGEKTRAISELMGVRFEEKEREVALVRCVGTCDKTKVKYNYHGTPDCKKLALIPGQGQKACDYGCMGFGTCIRSCEFGAMYMKGGVAVVDAEKCTACGKCVRACPRNLITRVPESASYFVLCRSKDKGKAVKAACEVGCIGCGICVKQCESDAIQLEDNLAVIDSSKCTKCGKCAAKCPTKVIKREDLT